jgi:hypothetical protein
VIAPSIKITSSRNHVPALQGFFGSTLDPIGLLLFISYRCSAVIEGMRDVQLNQTIASPRTVFSFIINPAINSHWLQSTTSGRDVFLEVIARKWANPTASTAYLGLFVASSMEQMIRNFRRKPMPAPAADIKAAQEFQLEHGDDLRLLNVGRKCKVDETKSVIIPDEVDDAESEVYDSDSEFSAMPDVPKKKSSKQTKKRKAANLEFGDEIGFGMTVGFQSMREYMDPDFVALEREGIARLFKAAVAAGYIISIAGQQDFQSVAASHSTDFIESISAEKAWEYFQELPASELILIYFYAIAWIY